MLLVTIGIAFMCCCLGKTKCIWPIKTSALKPRGIAVNVNWLEYSPKHHVDVKSFNLSVKMLRISMTGDWETTNQGKAGWCPLKQYVSYYYSHADMFVLLLSFSCFFFGYAALPDHNTHIASSLYMSRAQCSELCTDTLSCTDYALLHVIHVSGRETVYALLHFLALTWCHICAAAQLTMQYSVAACWMWKLSEFVVTLNNASDYQANGLLLDYIAWTNRLGLGLGVQ